MRMKVEPLVYSWRATGRRHPVRGVAPLRQRLALLLCTHIVVNRPALAPWIFWTLLRLLYTGRGRR